MDEINMEGTNKEGIYGCKDGESFMDGPRERIHKLINRFKQVILRNRTMLDSKQNSNTVKTTPASSTGDDVYDFCHQKRGFAVFIVNSEFDRQPFRPYADIDKDTQKLFEMMDFEVKLLENLTTKELKKQLKAIRSHIGTNTDCFACVISSHGAEEHSDSGRYRQHLIFTKDGNIPTYKIMGIFNSDNCPKLEGKPRLFFIQACRSIWNVSSNAPAFDKGFEFELVCKENEKESVSPNLGMQRNFVKQSEPDTQGQPGKYLHNTQTTSDKTICEIPCFEDYLVMFSSSSEKIAWSDKGKGGWLIYCLYEVFNHLLDSEESVNLLQVLTNVCGKMALELQASTSSPMYDKSKSAATINHMLTKNILFKPIGSTAVTATAI